MLVRDRRTLASCFFLSLGVLQLAGLSVSGAKWVRYSLVVLPFLFLAGGYAVQATWDRMREKKMSLAFSGLAAVTLFALPLLELHAWSPYFSFYLNSIGGGQKNIARYFGQDEVSEFDTREVAQQVCSSAHAGARLATARPMTMTYYIQNCGRNDIEVVSLYDRHYVPREGDTIILEPSRRFFETQRFFDALEKSGMSRREVRVGPVLASTIYLFDSSTPQTTGHEQWTLTQLRESPSSLATTNHNPAIPHKKADMVVRAEYEAPNRKVFTIVSESGSDTVRSRVFKKLLEAEQESMREENQQRSAITPQNYTFQLTDYQRIGGNEFYVLQAQPLTNNKFLFRGRIWVDAKEFAIAQCEGEPSANTTWWTVKTDFTISYQTISSFWLPESNESETKVRIFGSAVLTIKYGEYQITQTHNLTPAFDVEKKPSNGQ